MLSEAAIIEVNNLLDLSDSYRMSDYEIQLLNKTGADPQNTCDYYDTAFEVLTARSTTDTRQNKSIDVLIRLADIDDCELKKEPEKIPNVDIPFFAIGGID